MQRRRKKTPPSQKTPRSQSSTADVQQTFLEHLYELRSRLFWITISLVVTSAIGFQYKDALVSFVMAPLHGEKLVYLTPGGGFSFIFTVCLYFGALLTIPVIVYHIYRFLQPVLGKTSKRLVSALLFLSAGLALGGAAFGYYVAVPAAIKFLTTFAGDAVTPNLTAESYLGFIVAYMLGLAALFQLPLLLYMFDHVRPFPPGALLSSQRFVIVGAVIAAALITPTPDIVNQMIVALPIIVIYQLGAVAVYVRRKVGRRKSKQQPNARPVDEPQEDLTRLLELEEPRRLAQAPKQQLLQTKTQAKTLSGVVGSSPAVKKPSSSPASRVVATRTSSMNHQSSVRRSMDGFTRRSAPVLQRREAVVAPRRVVRSVDGLSMV